MLGVQRFGPSSGHGVSLPGLMIPSGSWCWGPWKLKFESRVQDALASLLRGAVVEVSKVGGLTVAATQRSFLWHEGQLAPYQG